MKQEFLTPQCKIYMVEMQTVVALSGQGQASIVNMTEEDELLFE